MVILIPMTRDAIFASARMAGLSIAHAREAAEYYDKHPGAMQNLFFSVDHLTKTVFVFQQPGNGGYAEASQEINWLASIPEFKTYFIKRMRP
jgi:hypothetical protein